MPRKLNPTLADPYGDGVWIRYVRRSRDRSLKESKSTSVRKQQEKTTTIAEDHGVPVHPDFFIDRNYSGGTHDRPRFQQALDLIKSGQAAGMIVIKQSRFSRDKIGIIAELDLIQKAGGRVLMGGWDHPADLHDQHDYARITTEANRDAQELEDRREYGNDSREDAIKRGISLGCPYGYRRQKDEDGDPAPLAIHDGEARQVRTIFDLRAQGWSWHRMLDHLNNRSNGLRRLDGGEWTLSRLVGIIGNRTYLGEARSGEFVNDTAHDPIVSRAVWDRANEKGSGPRKGDTEVKGLLSGTVRCASCSYRMVRRWSRTTDGSKIGYYRCKKKHGGGQCPGPVSVNADQLDQWVLDHVLDGWGDVADTPTGTMTTKDLDAAKAALAEAKAEVTAITRRQVSRVKAGASDEELTVYDDALAEAGQVVTRASHRLDAVAAEVFGGGDDLPDDLDADGIKTAPLAVRRRVVSRSIGVVFVRRPDVWREPVADRSKIVTADRTPRDLPGTGGTAKAAPQAVTV